MGLFDTIYVDAPVAAAWRLSCGACGRRPKPGQEWQTKSLDPCMYSYVLRHDEAGVVRLYLLDRPSDRRFWRPWTEEEIAESEGMAAKGGLFSLWQKKRGEGCFLPEAHLPENRRHRFMGELPHQWLEMYGTCECGEFITCWVKFSDGVAGEWRSERPEPAPDVFANAGNWGAAFPEDS